MLLPKCDHESWGEWVVYRRLHKSENYPQIAPFTCFTIKALFRCSFAGTMIGLTRRATFNEGSRWEDGDPLFRSLGVRG